MQNVNTYYVIYIEYQIKIMDNLKDTKSEILAFRLKKIEKQNIELMAEKQNISKGAYIRQQLFKTI